MYSDSRDEAHTEEGQGDSFDVVVEAPDEVCHSPVPFEVHTTDWLHPLPPIAQRGQ